MAKIHLLRGYKSTVYFVERVSEGDRLVQLQFRSNGQVDQSKVFQVSDGQIVAFGYDGDNRTNKKEETRQALYVMDDRQHIYHIVAENGVKYNLNRSYHLD